MEVRATRFSMNRCELQGGGVYLASMGLFSENTLTGNGSDFTGGGLFIYQHAPQIRHNEISANSAVNDGGGIYAHQSPALIIDNTVVGNVSGDDGGGIRIFESAAPSWPTTGL